jgi:hypothetical protein
MHLPAGYSRRQFLNQFGLGLGGIALSDMMLSDQARGSGGALSALHHPPKAKRVIYLFQAGGPSQIDTWDYKPKLNEMHGAELPAAVRGTQRLTGMSGNQSSLPLVGSPFQFSQHGSNGTWVSELLPHTAKIVDDLCVVRSMTTDAINHGPGVTFLQSGSQLPGRPSIGAWLSYGLGSDSENLPAFVVLLTKDKGGQPLAARLWGSGFLPSEHQGVQFRSGGDPVLYLRNPEGISVEGRRKMLDAMQRLHEIKLQESSDPFVEARIAQHELAFRMQMSIPDVTDISQETDATLESYGPQVRERGSFASNCLLARRLAEKGVRFIQLYHQGWDQHGGLPRGLANQCRETDQPAAALVQDLKQRGMLDDTLVIWGGEFGRTNYCQGNLNAENFGRDHHPRCFTMWMAGGGIQPGMNFGGTDEFGYNVLENPVHVHDFHATLLHLLGIDHERLTFRYQGRQFRLTDVHGELIQPIMV